ncbi:MAG: hypothetical protein FD180_4539 [Planctomycetota bacterium]|nr:MAG: hypothetical protein FD180_4539 [Planctomycetota bacterium]
MMLRALLLSMTVTGLAAADGCFFPTKPEKARTEPVGEPEQLAVITFDGTRQTMALRVAYDGPVESFAWVLPAPARPEIEVEPGDPFGECAQTVYDAMKVRYDWFLKNRPELADVIPGTTEGPAAASLTGLLRPVRILETKQAGDYQVTVLDASDAGALKKWLDESGYGMPDGAEKVLEFYVKKKWFFAAIKVRTEAKPQDLKPIRISFDAARPVFPLRISSLNAGATRVRIWLWHLPFPEKDRESGAGAPWTWLAHRGPRIRFSKELKDRTEWEFENLDAEVVADFGPVAGCKAVKAGAPDFFKAAEKEGAALATYEGFYLPVMMLDDVEFLHTAYGNSEEDFEAPAVMFPILPSGRVCLREIADAARSVDAGRQRAAVCSTQGLFLRSLDHAAREALLACARIHAWDEDPLVRDRARELLREQWPGSALDRVEFEARKMKVDLAAGAGIVPGKTPAAVLEKSAEDPRKDFFEMLGKIKPGAGGTGPWLEEEGFELDYLLVDLASLLALNALAGPGGARVLTSEEAAKAAPAVLGAIENRRALLLKNRREKNHLDPDDFVGLLNACDTVMALGVEPHATKALEVREAWAGQAPEIRLPWYGALEAIMNWLKIEDDPRVPAAAKETLREWTMAELDRQMEKSELALRAADKHAGEFDFGAIIWWMERTADEALKNRGTETLRAMAARSPLLARELKIFEARR